MLFTEIFPARRQLNSENNHMKANCDFCMNYAYDEEFDEYVCSINMDEDDYERILRTGRDDCPYFRFGDDYSIVRKQN